MSGFIDAIMSGFIDASGFREVIPVVEVLIQFQRGHVSSTKLNSTNNTSEEFNALTQLNSNEFNSNVNSNEYNPREKSKEFNAIR